MSDQKTEKELAVGTEAKEGVNLSDQKTGKKLPLDAGGVGSGDGGGGIEPNGGGIGS